MEARRPQQGGEGHAGHRLQGQQPEKQARFGINSLINRMTGHAPEPSHRSEPQRIQPQVSPTAEDESDPERERIDIPAFLRRQAN